MSRELSEAVKVGRIFNRGGQLHKILEIDPEKKVFNNTGFIKTVDDLGNVSWITFGAFEGLDPIPPSEIKYSIVRMMDRIADLTESYRRKDEVIQDLYSQIEELTDRIREFEQGKFKIVEVDQWTSTGNIEELSLDDFAVERVSGGDADAARSAGIASGRIREVFGDECPSIGRVWFRENEDGELEQWKANYDTSD